MVWPKTLVKQRHTYKAGYLKGLEIISQEPLKSYAFLWVKLIFIIEPPSGRGGGDSSIDPFPPFSSGQIEFTWQEVMIGLESSLLMFPINLLIVQIFRNTHPWVTKEHSTQKWDRGSLSPAPTPQPMEDGLLTPEVVTKVCLQPWQCERCSNLGRSRGGD